LAALVVPIADAGVGLPGAGPDFFDQAALYVEKRDASFGILLALAGVDRLRFAALSFGALVIVASDQVETIFL
jgi:hypothetical protein